MHTTLKNCSSIADVQPTSKNMVRFGVIGYGYWGPNVVRNLTSLEGSELITVCDKSPAARRRMQKAHPGIAVATEASEIVGSTDIDAVAVVTPVWTHYELAKKALENGKHVFVEKPFTATAAQAAELIESAARKIRQLVDDGTLGNLYYYDSMRVNLGLFQHDVNVLWDLAPHDLAIMD